MANATATVYWVDAQLKRGSFSFLFDDSLYATPYTELLAFIEDLAAASNAQIEAVLIAAALDISSITNPVAVDTGNYDTLGDQAVMQSRAASGALTKYTVPAPINDLFEVTGAFAYADVDLTAAEVVALKATGDALIRTKENATVVLQKGWRKDQKHS